MLIAVFGLSLLSLRFKDGDKTTLNSDGYIRWGERKLEWSDFKGLVPNKSKFHALTQSAINLEFDTDKHVLEFTIETIFDPQLSWRTEDVNTYMLQHEQVHFDITEYHARLLRKAIINKKFKSFASINREVSEVYHEIHEKAKEMQEAYDHETEHSLNKEAQAKWNKKMSRLLEKMTTFTEPTIKINIEHLIND